MTAPTPTTDPPLRRRAAESVHPLDLLGLTVLAVLIRLPGYLAAAHLTFDDGVFGASAIAMRHGGVPFREVFSSQGPLFLPVTWLGDLIGGRTLDSPRFASLASGLALTLIARFLQSRSKV